MSVESDLKLLGLPADWLHKKLNAPYFEEAKLQWDAAKKELKSIFRSRSKSLHPDINDNPDSHKEFVAMKAAYDRIVAIQIQQKLPEALQPIRITIFFGGSFTFGGDSTSSTTSYPWSV